MNKRKVFFIIPSYAGGGAERATITIASELSKEDNLDVSLVVLNAEGPLKDLAEDVQTIEFKNSRSIFAFFELRSYLKQNKPDVLFSVLPQANILVYLINKVTKQSWKTVCMLQNYYERLVSENSFIISWLFRKSLESSDAVVACSKGVSKNLCDNTLADKSSSHYIFNPVDIKKIQNQSREIVNGSILESQKNIVLGVGSLTKQKGFKYLIDAIAQAINAGDDLDLVLLGKGALKRRLKKKAAYLQISNHVHFLGFVDNPYKYMRAADVFVLSSLWEGFGLVLVEAMATETPIVATDCPYGPSEILKQGSLGTLVPPADSDQLASAIVNTLRKEDNNREERIARAQDFKPKKIADKYRNLINDLR
jgi:glycosyltransferase involved in cell wall biosynthesis